MRLGLTSLSIFGLGVGLGACGGGTVAPDAPAVDIGFTKPTKSLKANTSATDGTGKVTWSEVGAANLACLNTPSSDVATTVPVSLSTTVKDFQNQTPVIGASITAFAGIDVGTPFGAAAVSDGSGDVTVAIPAGQKRFGFKMTQTDSIDTLLLNQTVDPSMTTQTSAEIQIVSLSTATLLPALIGENRTTGSGVAAGALRDCDKHEISNFVVTMSSTPGTATPIDGAQAFYFALSPTLPIVHHSAELANQNGLFMMIQVPVTATGYVQAWGYPTDADLAADHLTLISELAVPVVADTVITGSFEPLRQ